MKIILYTERVEVVKAYQETRDCADRRIPEFLEACGFLPIPAPNRLEIIRAYMRELSPNGAFLTGGNNLVQYGGNSPERDAVDSFFIEQAIDYGFPVFGICRGMQSILDYFNVPLHKVQGHVATTHAILYKDEMRRVNSYHTLSAKTEDISFPLRVVGNSMEKVAEAIEREGAPLKGIMWHPEREEPFCQEDIEMVRTFFNE